MLITKTVKIKWNSSNKKWYESKGYIFTQWKDEIDVKIEDLSKGSHAMVDVQCETCRSINEMSWKTYNNRISTKELYYCKKCCYKQKDKVLKYKETKIKSGKSFEQWCIDNNRRDILDRWDYELNQNKIPKNITYGDNNKFWFKCPNGMHPSEQKSINNFTNGSNGTMRCKTCYSLGGLYPDIINLWSDKNKKSPYEYTPKSSVKVWFKCSNGKHEDYLRDIHNSVKYDFRCPECQFSKGEKSITEYLITNRINYIPQKEFNGLVGINNGNLSYDFYLPQNNLLIEYQGEYHDGSGHNDYIKENLEKQQEHDRRKREYAKEHNIKLLEIWYWDFDNIEKILAKELNLNNEDNNQLKPCI